MNVKSTILKGIIFGLFSGLIFVLIDFFNEQHFDLSKFIIEALIFGSIISLSLHFKKNLTKRTVIKKLAYILIITSVLLIADYLYTNAPIKYLIPSVLVIISMSLIIGNKKIK